MSLDKFIQLADSLVEFYSDLNENLIPVTSIHAVKVQRDEVKSTWSQIKAAYDKFLSEKKSKADDDEEKDLVDLETFRNKYKNSYVTYSNILTKLAELAETLHSKESLNPVIPLDSQTLKDKSPTDVESHNFSLPPCDIEVFNGDYMAWPTFRDLFTAVYIKNSRLSPVEKLFHLTQKTRGEPREIVQKSPLTNSGFELAWSSLCARYENRRVLVNGQLKTLFNLSAITSESGTALKQLQRSINSCISILKLYDIDVDSWDPIFVFICSNRLPDITLTLWEQGLENKTIIPMWSELDTFITNRYRTLESVSEIRKCPDTQTKPKKDIISTKRINTFQNNVVAPNCPLCPKEAHIIRKCPRFLKMDHSQKYNEIKKLNLCVNCFSKAHSARNCSSKNTCFHCKKRHNSLLHRDKIFRTPSKPHSSSTSNSNTVLFQNSVMPSSSSNNNLIQNCFASNSMGVLLGTAVINIVHSGMEFRARALIDSGSEGTFISDRMFNRLKLPFEKINAKILGLNKTVSATVQKRCSLTLNSRLDSRNISINALVVPHLAEHIPSQNIKFSSFSDLPEIPLADPYFHNSAMIDILIGGDVIPSIMCSGIQLAVCGSLLAQETIFGWILTGPVTTNARDQSAQIVSCFSEISLEREISRFWEVEDLPRNKLLSHSEKFCEELYKSTTQKSPEGRYIVSLPFKEGYPEELRLGQSRNSALAQFFRNESRLLRNPDFKSAYDNVVQEYEDLNHMSEVSSDRLNNPLHYYLPHHAVIKPESTTTKVRVVFNASSPTSNGLSLNSILYPGPTLQNDLTLLILNWRFFRFVFNADIQKMYRQILIDPKHTPFQRILFRKSPNESVKEFELKTVTFGVNCAPYLAIRTMIQLADDIQYKYPTASRILKENMYVDDVLAGEHTISAAIDAKNELINALKTAGLSLRKWTANAKQILDDFPTSYLLRENFLDFDDKSTAKTLGIRWNASSDSFFFVPTVFFEPSKYTKREVFSQISRLFDPAGWLAPCVVLAKILMQRIWVEGTAWDEVISDKSLAQWKSFQSNYPYIRDIRVPRWLNFTPNSVVQFHGFCDASERAYAAVLYVRIAYNNIIHTHLVTAKTRVAPVKTLSIPRLELCGAVLLAEMIDSIIPKLDLKSYEIYCWTDSTIVLAWLAKSPCRWLTFVANRISKIVQITDPTHWRHVSSENNPADIASRGILPPDIVNNDLWWKGPKFIQKLDCEDFFQKFRVPDTDLEQKPIKVHFSYFQNFEDAMQRFSSFARAIRVFAYIYRFFYRTHPKYKASFSKTGFTLTAFEIKQVRDQLIKMYQKAFYPDEYKRLLAKEPVLPSSKLLNLNRFLDPEGIIRSCGRLESSPGLSYNERHPILLPYDCQYSRLLVKFVHAITLHGGNQLVLRIIRTQYWIPKYITILVLIIYFVAFVKGRPEEAAFPKEPQDVVPSIGSSGAVTNANTLATTESSKSYVASKVESAPDYCFQMDENLCLNENTNSSNNHHQTSQLINTCQCRQHPNSNATHNNWYCCNITQLSMINSCPNTGNWTNLHIYNVTMTEIDLSSPIFQTLQSLAITDGNITRIVKTFSRMSKVKCLNLSNNNLLNITIKTPIFLKFLNLSKNNLTQIPKLGPNQNITMDIRDNKRMLCNNLVETIFRGSFKFVSPNSSFCLMDSTFNWFNTTDYIAINQIDIIRRFHTDCPVIPGKGNCTCAPEHMLSAGDPSKNKIFCRVDCSNLGLIELPPKLPENTFQLNITNNNITVIGEHFHNNPTYQSIVKLLADNNNIESMHDLEGTKFMDHFQRLYLRNNNIKRLPEYLLTNVLDSIMGRQIFLGGNKLICDCNSAKVLKLWLLQRSKDIPDYVEIKCRNIPQRVMELQEIKVCQSPHDWTDYVYYLIATEVILLIALITKVSYDYWVFKTAGYLPWPASKMPKLPCDWLCES